MPSRSQLIALTFFLLLGSSGMAQTLGRSSISSGGNTGKSGTIILSYNIGEPVTELHFKSIFGSLSIGFMQPDADILSAVLIKNISQELAVYPNPVISGTAKLDFKNIPNGTYQVEVIDAVGHVLYTKNIAYSIDNKINLDLNVAGFKGGTYYIRVRNGLVQGQVKLVKL
jgi:hypothetical protein